MDKDSIREEAASEGSVTSPEIHDQYYMKMLGPLLQALTAKQDLSNETEKLRLFFLKEFLKDIYCTCIYNAINAKAGRYPELKNTIRISNVMASD